MIPVLCNSTVLLSFSKNTKKENKIQELTSGSISSGLVVLEIVWCEK